VRERGQKLLESIRGNKLDSVVIRKLNRIYRSTGAGLTKIEKWERGGVSLHVVDLGGNAIDTTSAGWPHARFSAFASRTSGGSFSTEPSSRSYGFSDCACSFCRQLAASPGRSQRS